MSHITFKLAAVIEHQPYSLAPDQHEPLLEEHEYTVQRAPKKKPKAKSSTTRTPKTRNSDD